MLRNVISDERGKPRVMSCATRNVAVYAANTGSEKQEKQGEHHTPPSCPSTLGDASSTRSARKT